MAEHSTAGLPDYPAPASFPQTKEHRENHRVSSIIGLDEIMELCLQKIDLYGNIQDFGEIVKANQ